ncbi:MAG: NADH-quinone oxidoreductase subunit H [Helicobacteraceae bacterium]|jgi:ech hydrogenase subunit B|nr:NADH-quinone oxidoreductase subunit H [Helicobacteraceae bacterium]
MIGWILTLLSPLMGGFVFGAERVVRARMQRRKGPPLLQPFYDFFKLLNKRTMIVHSLHACLGILHFFCMWLAVAVLLTGGDIVMAVIMHLMSSCFLIVGASSVRSTYSQIGGIRELLSIMAYEPIFLIAAVGFYLVTGSFEARAVFSYDGLPIASLWLIFAAVLMVLPFALKKSPFDIVEAHQEIIGGPEIEYSGLFFEAVYTAKWLEYIFVYTFIYLFAGSFALIGAALVVLVFFLVNALDNAVPRLSWRQCVPFALLTSLLLGLINLLWIGVV